MFNVVLCCLSNVLYCCVFQKRVCVGPALIPQRIDVAMEISWTPPPAAPQPEHQQTHPTSMVSLALTHTADQLGTRRFGACSLSNALFQTQPTSQCCPRCLAGEPVSTDLSLSHTAVA